MNELQNLERAQHPLPEGGEIVRVLQKEQGYQIDSTEGCFLLTEPCDFVPEAGMSITLYRFNGGKLQGVDIDSKPIFFKTHDEMEQDCLEVLMQIDIRKAREREKFFTDLADPQSDFNVRRNKLPKVFQQRIARFLRLGDDFCHVAVYELYACEAAVKIAYACKSQSRVLVFMRSSPDEERLNVLGEDIYNYLSGHQFTFACALAHSYIKKAKSVRNRPGAMQMLAGKKMYTG